MSSTKLHRWLDLLASLLSRRAPATFADLARDVPGYAAALGAETNATAFQSAKRTFERDKDELRALGIPILSLGANGDEGSAYQLKPNDFYLPYLALVSERGVQSPPKVDRYGYHSLATLAFEPDELEAIRDGASRAMQSADPSLAEHARNALRKLAFDLPLGATDELPSDAAMLQPLARPDATILATLGDALLRRKRATIVYRTISRNQEETRTIEPYGLFFLSGHWYLTANDTSRDGLRNFRVSRVSDATVNAAKAATPDYDIPKSFDLREHARSKLAWELGDGEGYEAAVDFRGDTGAVRAAAALGRAHDDSPTLRTFDVRRTDSFVRWLLAFGGDAIPVSPPALVDEYALLAQRTRALYTREVAR